MINDLKYESCYTIRYLCWEFSLFLVIATAFPGKFVALITLRLLQNFFVSLQTTNALFQSIQAVIYLFLLYLISRFALHEVFLKPYRKFTLYPKIKNIGSKISCVFFGFRLFAIFLFGFVCRLLLASFSLDIHSDLFAALVDTVVLFVVYVVFTFVALKRIVHKYAEISEI